MTYILACCFNLLLPYLTAQFPLQFNWVPDAAVPEYPMVLFKTPCIESLPVLNPWSSFSFSVLDHDYVDLLPKRRVALTQWSGRIAD